MDYVNSYRELEVNKLCPQLSKEIFETSKAFSQIRRSSRSIGGQIADAWAKRKYEKHFVSKLTDAKGEQLETNHWIDTALDCVDIKPEIADRLLDQYTYVERMLNAVIDKSSSFCE